MCTSHYDVINGDTTLCVMEKIDVTSLLDFLSRLPSIAAHRDHFVWRLSVRLSGSHTFLVVTHSYVSLVTHAFLGMLPLCSYVKAQVNEIIKMVVSVSYTFRT